MKHSTIIIAVLTIVASVAFAATWFNDPKVAPTVPLPDAYRQAMIALGSATNTFHCTEAQWQRPGWWRFSFYNTNGVLKTVDADRVFDGQPPVF
jgi:hypothetical protein